MIAIFAAILLQQAPAAAPHEFRGDWAREAADCAHPALRVRVDAAGVHRGADVWDDGLASDLRQDAEGLHWVHRWDDPESGSWETAYTLSPPLADRLTLTRDGKGGRRSFVYRRCPGAAPAA